jgi:trk system potassium uptake protein TrkA
MEQFMVIGLGNFGFNIADNLSKAGRQVIAVDTNSQKVEEIKDKVKKAVIVDVCNKKSLSEVISSSKADVVIVCLGNKLEASILATLYLKEMKIEKIIAKASSKDHAIILKTVGADEVVFPKQEMAKKLTKRLLKPNLIDYIPMAEEYSIFELDVPDEFVGKTLSELELRNKYHIEVIVVKNIMNNNFIHVPAGDYRFEPDTAMVVIGKDEDIEKIKVK